MDHLIPTNFYSHPHEGGKSLVSTCSSYELRVCYLHRLLVSPFQTFTFLFECQIFLPCPPLLKLSLPALFLWLNVCVMMVSASCVKQNYLFYLVLQDVFPRPQADLCISFPHPKFKPPKAEPVQQGLLSGGEPRISPVAQPSPFSISVQPWMLRSCHTNKRYLTFTPVCISTSSCGKHSSGSGTSARDKKSAHKSPQNCLTSKEKERNLLFSHTQSRFQLLHSAFAHAQSIKCHCGSAPHSHSQNPLEFCLLSSQGLPQELSLMAISCHFLLELTLGMWVAASGPVSQS